MSPGLFLVVVLGRIDVDGRHLDGLVLGADVHFGGVDIELRKLAAAGVYIHVRQLAFLRLVDVASRERNTTRQRKTLDHYVHRVPPWVES